MIHTLKEAGSLVYCFLLIRGGVVLPKMAEDKEFSFLFFFFRGIDVNSFYFLSKDSSLVKCLSVVLRRDF